MAKYKIFTTLSHIIAHHKTYLHIPKTQENSAAFYNFSSRATLTVCEKILIPCLIIFTLNP